MRYLVYFLVLVNVAYLGWNIYQNQTASEVMPELPPLPTGVVPLVTLPELEEQRLHAEEISAVDALTTSQPPGAGTALICQAIGPFLAMEDLQTVSGELYRHGLQARQRTSEIQKPNGFWVYLPAMERDQALRAVKTLEENKDREYFVGKGNYIALGTFADMSRAEVRLEQVRKLGFEPILEARYQTFTEYWLDIDAQTAVTSELDSILRDRPGLKLQETSCP
jgi:hypothetical protein